MPSNSQTTFLLVLLTVFLLVFFTSRTLFASPEQSTPSSTGVESEDVAAKTDKLGDYVSFPGVGVAIRQPDGFIVDDSFEGFGMREKQISVMALSLPGPFREISGGFTEMHIEEQGWTFLSREELKVGDMPAVFIQFEQTAAGTVFEKLTLTFGSDEKTTLVTATYPKEFRDEFSAELRAAVLSSRPAKADPAAEAPDLTVEGSKKLRRTFGVSGLIIYTLKGKIPADAPEDPLFLIGKGFRVVLDTKGFAEQRLRTHAHTKNVANVSTTPFSVDGLEGFESTATARDEESNIPLILYQAIVFDEKDYILMVGLVGVEKQEEYLPEFKKMARSLRRTKTP